jgi:hypothetical protein
LPFMKMSAFVFISTFPSLDGVNRGRYTPAAQPRLAPMPKA